MAFGLCCSAVVGLFLYLLAGSWLLEDLPYVTSFRPCGRPVCIIDQGPAVGHGGKEEQEDNKAERARRQNQISQMNLKRDHSRRKAVL